MLEEKVLSLLRRVYQVNVIYPKTMAKRPRKKRLRTISRPKLHSKNCKFADEKLINEFLACTRPRSILSMLEFTARTLRRFLMKVLKLFNLRFKICC